MWSNFGCGLSATDMDTPWSVRFIAGMWKYAIAAFVGFLVTVLTLAVGREVYLAFQARPAAEVIGSAVHWVGTFQWLFDYQTLLTGAAAALGVIWQIRQASSFQKASFESKRAAARATLPLTLSRITEHALTNGDLLDQLSEEARRRGGRLPRTYSLPSFSEFEDQVTSELRQMVEYAEPAERSVLATLLGKIQVHSSRLRGLADEQKRSRGIPLGNLETYVGDAGEIYVRAGALFEFARGDANIITADFPPRETVTALHFIGIYDDERVERISRQINRNLARASKF